MDLEKRRESAISALNEASIHHALSFALKAHPYFQKGDWTWFREKEFVPSVDDIYLLTKDLIRHIREGVSRPTWDGAGYSWSAGRICVRLVVGDAGSVVVLSVVPCEVRHYHDISNEHIPGSLFSSWYLDVGCTNIPI